MTIRSLPNQYIPATGGNPWSTSYMVWYWLDWMRQAPPVGPGWTIPLASSGTAYGNGSVLTGVGSLNYYNPSTQRSWFVLRAPDGSRDYLFQRYDTTSGHFYIYMSKSGSLTGGGQWATPTAADLIYVASFEPLYANYAGVLHCAADDAAPYGFWAYYNVAGTLADDRAAFVSIPMDLQAVPGDDDPFVFFQSNYATATGINRSRMSTESGPTNGYLRSSNAVGAGMDTVTGCFQRNDNNQIAPNNLDILPSGEDVSVPIFFARRSGLGSGYYKGISSFMQWNGRQRAIGEMFAGRTRISLGDVNLPWDGVSDFLVS